MDTITPVLDQESFQGRDDDVSGVNNATFNGGGGLNGDWTQAVDTPFRIRFEVQETAGGDSKNNQFSLEYNKEGGGWNPVGLASSNVQIENSGNFNNGDATTQVIGDGSFVGSTGVEDPGTSTSNTSLLSQSTEAEFCLTIVSGDVDNGNTIDIRVAGLDGWTQTPTVTVSEGAAPTRRVMVIS